MTRVAAVDCGTNSVRLLVADIDAADAAAGVADVDAAGVADAGAARLTDVVRRMDIVRLGEGVDRTGRLAPAALERTMTALASYAVDIERLGAERVRMVATSATRDAANRAEFVDAVFEVLGVVPEVVTGKEEAALSFAGATRELSGCRFAPPYLVVDIGGGSTEFVLGSSTVTAAHSIDIGCVRLTERHLASDPPSGAQVAAAEQDVAAGLDAVADVVPLHAARTLVGLAGSVTTVAALALGLPAYDPARIHHARVGRSDVGEISDRLLRMTSAERAALPAMHPGRVDVIAAGALVLRMTLDRLGLREVVASEHDILDGIAWSLAGPAPSRGR